jgi:hypothetical protein
MTKCLSDKLTVYAHDGAGKTSSVAVKYLNNAVSRYPEYLEKVADPEKACLLLLSCDSFDRKEDMYGHPSWKGGQNHLVWESSRCFGHHSDRPFGIHAHFQKAALAAVSMTDDSIRIGYDVPLPYVKKDMRWQLPEVFPTHPHFPWGKEGNDAARWWHEDRPVILSLKAHIYPWPQVNWQHRYLAVEYWERADDITVDTTCAGHAKYDTPADGYQLLLRQTTFAFTAGGGSVGSYRFNEVLGMGCIPIVMAHFLPPFSPDIDWSGCLLTTHEGRIADLPRLVRSISKEEIVARRQRCAQLFRQTVSWEEIETDQLGNSSVYRIDLGKRASMTGLLIWQKRIQHVLEMKAFMPDGGLDDGLRRL